MEARLGAARKADGVDVPAEPSGGQTDESTEAVAVASEGAPNAWPDESTESAILSELRERGEKPVPVATEAIEETDTKPLPALDELVKRLSPQVRETLDELFRARFVRVARVPQKALKQ